MSGKTVVNGRPFTQYLVGKPGRNVFLLKDETITGESLIISLENGKGFSVFKGQRRYYEFFNYIIGMENPGFHEVNSERHSTSKLVFDLDISKGSPELANNVVKNLVDCLLKVADELKLPIEASDLLYFTSHGLNKQSIHIVVDRVHFDNSDMDTKFNPKWEITNKVKTKMNPLYAKYVDEAVNHRNHSLRTYMSYKNERVKIFNREWQYGDVNIRYKSRELDEAEDEYVYETTVLMKSLITCTVDCQYIKITREQFGVPEFRKPTSAVDCNVDEVLDFVEEFFKTIDINFYDIFEYKEQVDGLISFIKKPGISYMCPKCQREHENENPYVTVFGPENSVYFNCRRSEDGKGIYLGMIYPEKKAEKVELDDEIVDAEFQKIIKPLRPTDKDIEYVEYNDRFFREIPDGYGTYFLDCPMGGGKTEQIKNKIIQEEARSKTYCTESLTFRIKLALAQKGRFSEAVYKEQKVVHEGLNFTLYSEDNEEYLNDPEKEIKYQREIRQAESLWKFAGRLPNILVVDECISFLKQMDRGCHGKNIDMNRNTFLYLVKESDIVIFADAYMDDRIIELAKNRTGKKLYIKNTFKPGSVQSDHLHFYEMKSEDHLIQKIRDTLKSGLKPCIVTPSKSMCHQLFSLLSSDFPDKIGKVYTADTDMCKNEIMNVNAHWNKLDFLIYNGSVGAGISFDPRYFHVQFILGNKGCKSTIEDLMQIRGRIRHMVCNKVYYYMPLGSRHQIFGTNPIYKKTVTQRLLTRDLIRRHLEFNILDLAKHRTIDKDRYIAWKIDENDYWTHLRISCLVDQNKTVCFYDKLFEHYVNRDGHSLHKNEEGVENDWDPKINKEEIKEAKKKSKAAVKNANINLYRTAPTKFEIVKQANDAIKSGDSTAKDKVIVKKHNYQSFCKEELTAEELLTFEKNYSKIANYLIELNSDVFTEYFRNIKNKSTRPTFDRLHYIQELCKRFGMQTSSETVTFENKQQFYNDYKTYVCDQFKILVSVFGKDSRCNCPKTEKAFIDFIKSLFNSWSGTTIVCDKTYYDEPSKKQHYSVTFETDKNLQSIFRKLDTNLHKQNISKISSDLLYR